ncbi:MAG TPA: SelB C-terminal domain-containing protein, partial [Acidimicrobiales bacterium]
RQRAILAAGLDGILVAEGRAAPATGANTVPDDAAAVLAQLERSPWSPPPLGPADRGALRILERRGLAVEAGGAWFAASAISSATTAVARLLAAHPEGISVATVRDALQASRKHVVPLLGHLDATGVTRRRGDLRVAGPRLPAITAPGRAGEPPAAGGGA